MTFTRNGKFREALIVRRLGPIRRSAEGRFFGAARYRGIADEEGRRQAFALVAGRCSVADAEILFEIREKRLFRAMEVTWEDFCSKRIGVTRSYVDRIIRQYREPGAAFCKLNSFTRFKPAEYRVIAGAVSEDGLAYGAEIIPLEAQNAPRLAEAVDALRRD